MLPFKALGVAPSPSGPSNGEVSDGISLEVAIKSTTQRDIMKKQARNENLFCANLTFKDSNSKSDEGCAT
jgi:hypothetical protein